jgi:hypothetical protein
MVKYRSLEDEGFKKVARRVSRMTKSAVKKIEENWERWEKISGP